MNREHETRTPLYLTRVSDVRPAVVPSDGGRYVIYCDHFDARTGEWYNAALLQDDDKRRLASWIGAKRGAGFTEWCEECQAAHELHARAGA